MATINPKKMSDGTGRDTYIQHAAELKVGRESLGNVSSVKPFRHWDLRSPSSPGRSLSGGPATAAALKKRSGSHRRGGRGWQPSIDMDDSRRTQEAFAYTMRAASFRAPPLGAPSAMMLDLGVKAPVSPSGSLASPRRGLPCSGPVRPTDFATAIRAKQRSEPGSPQGGSVRPSSALRSTTGSCSWRPVGP